MHPCDPYRDVLAYLVMVSLATAILSSASVLVHVYLVLVVVLVPFRLQTASLTEWFSPFKFVGIVGGVLVLAHLGDHPESVVAHRIVAPLLVFNILGAALADLRSGHQANALCAVLLVLRLPLVWSHPMNPAAPCVSWGWILAYTSWNAAFSYASNFAWSTRLILLVPLGQAFIRGTPVWLVTRTLSLLVHLTWRALALTPFYAPGVTHITPLVGSVTHDDRLARRWGQLNLLVVLVCSAFNTFISWL